MSTMEVLSAEKRRQILEGAALVFADCGYEGASMSRIAAEAGVSKGTLYNYFENKADLFIAYVQSECAGKLAHLFEGLLPDEEPRAALYGVGLRMVHMMLLPSRLTVYRMAVSEGRKFPELASAYYEAGPAAAIRQLAAWLRHQTEVGRLDTRDPEFAAEQFLNLCRTRFSLRRELQMPGDVRPGEVGALVESAVTMFLNTYGLPARAWGGRG